MHATELIELAALFSTHRDAVLAESDPTAPPALMDYWAASKARHCRWSEFLTGWRNQLASADDEQQARLWKTAGSCLEEILLAELPTRVFAAVGLAIDDSRGMREWSPVTTSIFEREQEFEYRVLQSLLLSGRVEFELRQSLDQLRRRVERWTDMVLAPWQQVASIEQFAFDVDRLKDFAEGIRRTDRVGNETFWSLAVASLEGAFRKTIAPVPFSMRLNRQIATSMLGCFPQALLSLDDGAPSWVPRLLHKTRQTEQLIDAALRPTFRL